MTVRVHPLPEVRQRLSGILARFRREGVAAEAVAFGWHRRPEAILLPYELTNAMKSSRGSMRGCTPPLARRSPCRSSCRARSAWTMTGRSRPTWTERSARRRCTAGRSRATGGRECLMTRIATRLPESCATSSGFAASPVPHPATLSRRAANSSGSGPFPARAANTSTQACTSRRRARAGSTLSATCHHSPTGFSRFRPR